MARPKKEGMDYFPHDTDAVNDEKIEALRMLYGNDGYAFYFILLERIYRTKNAELDVSDSETMQILSRKVAVSIDTFEKMLETCFKREIFDRHEFEKRGVLTSNGIKNRVAPVVEKREKMRQKYRDSKEIVSDAETGKEPDKEKESKEKESKEDNKYIHFLFDHYVSKNIIAHKKMTKPMKSAINARLKDYAYEQLIQVIDNYAEVFFSNKHWFKQRYTLTDLMRDKDVRKFIDDADPLNNFLERSFKNNGVYGHRQSNAGRSSQGTSYEQAKRELEAAKRAAGR